MVAAHFHSAAPPASRPAPSPASSARAVPPAAIHPPRSATPSRTRPHTRQCCAPLTPRSAGPTAATSASTHTPAQTTQAASLPSPLTGPRPPLHLRPRDKALRAGHNLALSEKPPRTGPPSRERQLRARTTLGPCPRTAPPARCTSAPPRAPLTAPAHTA